MQPLSRVLQQICGRAQTCVLAQGGCVPVTLLQEISLCSLSPLSSELAPRVSPASGLRGADPQSRGWVCVETAPSPHRPLPQELPGKFPLLQSVPVPLPSLQPCQPRCSASRAISGSTLRHVPSAVGAMLKEMDSGGVHPPPVPVPGWMPAGAAEQAGMWRSSVPRRETLQLILRQRHVLCTPPPGAVMWQWDPEIRPALAPRAPGGTKG